MKFGKSWAAAVADLPDELRESCVPYAAWKKRTKQVGAFDWARAMADLTRDCKRVDCALGGAPRRLGGAIGELLCPGVRADVLKSDLLAFVELNRTCVRKLCKRIDKRGAEPRAVPWLRACCGAHAYAFLETATVAKLELAAGRAGSERECPVCMEPFGDRGGGRALVLRCGHAVCVGCALRMTGASGVYGTLYNALAYARARWPGRSRCPLCRSAIAFVGVGEEDAVGVRASKRP